MLVYRRSGSKVYYVRYKDKHGNLNWQSLKTKNVQVAHEKAKEIIQGYDKPDPNKITIKSCVDEYLVTCEANHAAKTYRNDKNSLNKLLQFCEHEEIVYISDLTLGFLEKYKIWRSQMVWKRKEDGKEHTVSKGMVNSDLKVFKSFINRLVADEKLPKSPIKDPAGNNRLKFYSVTNKKVRFLSTEEIKILLDTEKRPRWRALIAVAINTGMRPGELQHLVWDNVLFDQGLIAIAKQGEFDPKTRKVRYIPMNKTVRTILSGMKKTGNYVFGIEGDKPFLNNFHLQFRKIAKRAGLKGVTPNTLRHTFASHLAMAGVPLITIKDLMGHENIKTTMIYAHLCTSHTTGAVNKLQELAILK